MFPVQKVRHNLTVGLDIQSAAYEVYAHVCGEQKSLMNPNTCRGGFGTTELIAFLWARQFPQTEWKQRVEEAFANIKDGA